MAVDFTFDCYGGFAGKIVHTIQWQAIHTVHTYGLMPRRAKHLLCHFKWVCHVSFAIMSCTFEITFKIDKYVCTSPFFSRHLDWINEHVRDILIHLFEIWVVIVIQLFKYQEISVAFFFQISAGFSHNILPFDWVEITTANFFYRDWHDDEIYSI